jgi:hypothetical protein
VSNEYAHYINGKVAPKDSQTGILGLVVLLNYNISELFVCRYGLLQFW